MNAEQYHSPEAVVAAMHARREELEKLAFQLDNYRSEIMDELAGRRFLSGSLTAEVADRLKSEYDSYYAQQAAVALEVRLLWEYLETPLVERQSAAYAPETLYYVPGVGNPEPTV